jgi:hypothetical protein
MEAAVQRRAARLFRFLALAACFASPAPPVHASWQFQQVNDEDHIGGWLTEITNNEAGTPIIAQHKAAGDLLIYEILGGGAQRRYTFPNRHAPPTDLASSVNRRNLGAARFRYTPLFDTTICDLQLIEPNEFGSWSTHIVDRDLGVNSGSVALAYGSDSQPWIAYVRAATQTLQLATREPDGAWRLIELASGPQFSSYRQLDLALDHQDMPHVLFKSDSGLQHAWLSETGPQLETLPTDALVGDGTHFDRDGRLYVPAKLSFGSRASLVYVRDEAGWSPLNDMIITDSGTLPVLVFDQADRPHLTTVTHLNHRFHVRHRWWNGAQWRQETVASWGSFKSGPQAASLSIDGDNLLHVAFTETTDLDVSGGNLFYAKAPNTPLGTPLLIPASYDVQADGIESSWTVTDGGRRVLVAPTQTGEKRMLLSFDLSSVPEDAHIVGAELDFQQAGNLALGTGPPIRAFIHAFSDDGVPDPADADLDPIDLQVGFLDPVSAFSDDRDDLVVTRLHPSRIAAAVNSADSHLGILIRPNGIGTDAIYTTEESQAFSSRRIAPRLWLYLRQPGDFNADGHVDAADYVDWRRGLGTTYTQDHYNIWRANFGRTLAATVSGTASDTVPEPSSIASLLLAAVCFAVASAHRLILPTACQFPFFGHARSGQKFH